MRIREVDPFDLPDWLSAGPVTCTVGEIDPARVSGRFSALDGGEVDSQIWAIDRAYPSAVLPDQWRTPAHRAWSHGQVLLIEVEGTLVLAVPGVTLPAEEILHAVARFANAVGAAPRDYLVAIAAR